MSQEEKINGNVTPAYQRPYVPFYGYPGVSIPIPANKIEENYVELLTAAARVAGKNLVNVNIMPQPTYVPYPWGQPCAPANTTDDDEADEDCDEDDDDVCESECSCENQEDKSACSQCVCSTEDLPKKLVDAVLDIKKEMQDNGVFSKLNMNIICDAKRVSGCDHEETTIVVAIVAKPDHLPETAVVIPKAFQFHFHSENYLVRLLESGVDECRSISFAYKHNRRREFTDAVAKIINRIGNVVACMEEGSCRTYKRTEVPVQTILMYSRFTWTIFDKIEVFRLRNLGLVDNLGVCVPSFNQQLENAVKKAGELIQGMGISQAISAATATLGEIAQSCTCKNTELYAAPVDPIQDETVVMTVKSNCTECQCKDCDICGDPKTCKHRGYTCEECASQKPLGPDADDPDAHCLVEEVFKPAAAKLYQLIDEETAKYQESEHGPFSTSMTVNGQRGRISVTFQFGKPKEAKKFTIELRFGGESGVWEYRVPRNKCMSVVGFEDEDKEFVKKIIKFTDSLASMRYDWFAEAHSVTTGFEE